MAMDTKADGAEQNNQNNEQSAIPFKETLEENIKTILSELGNSADLSSREFGLGAEQVPAAALWVSGMVDNQIIEQNIFTPILDKGSQTAIKTAQADIYLWLRDSVITAGRVTLAESIDVAVIQLLSGNTVILADAYSGGISVGTQGYETRSIEEPSSTAVVRGPRDGFVESLAVNISLIRRRIRDKMLNVELLDIGITSRTQVVMIYLRHRADPKIVEDVRGKLQAMQLDSVLGSQYIQEMLQYNKPSMFPTVYSSERPDDIAGGILEGRVAILVDGTPFALIVPCTFFHLMRSPEDYYLSFQVATFIRWLRYVGFIITLLFPALYVGILTFHPEMVPPELLSSILAAREGIPFPVLLEALLMELTFEGLREASVRMPRAIGSAISIVGALVIGESAVNAGIISPPTVIVVAGTAIASFTIPSIDLSGAARLLRFFMLFFASILGLYGIVLGMVMLGIHMTSIKSAGIPYLSPIAPYKNKEAAKIFARLPWWSKLSQKIHSR